MPVHSGFDTSGCYYQWGQSGARYHYKCGSKVARENAKQKAIDQGIAAGNLSEVIKYKSKC